MCTIRTAQAFKSSGTIGIPVLCSVDMQLAVVSRRGLEGFQLSEDEVYEMAKASLHRTTVPKGPLLDLKRYKSIQNEDIRLQGMECEKERDFNPFSYRKLITHYLIE